MRKCLHSRALSASAWFASILFCALLGFPALAAQESALLVDSHTDADVDLVDGTRIDGRKVYRLTILNPFNSSPTSFGEGSAINNSGYVAGTVILNPLTDHGTAFLWRASSSGFETIIPGGGTHATGINSSTRVVGNAYFPGLPFGPRAYLYANAAARNIGTLGGDFSNGFDINDRGWIVGESSTHETDGAMRAFLYRNGPTFDSPQETGRSLKSLGTLGGRNSAGFSLNNRGDATGWSQLPGNARQHAVLFYKEGRIQDLGTLGGAFAAGTGINFRREIAGWSSTRGEAAVHAFLYAGGTMKDLGTLGGQNSYAADINARGQVVGKSQHAASGTDAFNTRGFIYDSGRMFDLNDLVDESIAGWTIKSANAINDHGQITGAAANASGTMKAYVLSLIRRR